MTAPTDPLQIAAALCENVYRRGDLARVARINQSEEM
jgi:hypothetical protein